MSERDWQNYKMCLIDPELSGEGVNLHASWLLDEFGKIITKDDADIKDAEVDDTLEEIKVIFADDVVLCELSHKVWGHPVKYVAIKYTREFILANWEKVRDQFKKIAVSYIKHGKTPVPPLDLKLYISATVLKFVKAGVKEILCSSPFFYYPSTDTHCTFLGLECLSMEKGDPNETKLVCCAEDISKEGKDEKSLEKSLKKSVSKEVSNICCAATGGCCAEKGECCALKVSRSCHGEKVAELIGTGGKGALLSDLVVKDIVENAQTKVLSSNIIATFENSEKHGKKVRIEYSKVAFGNDTFSCVPHEIKLAYSMDSKAVDHPSSMEGCNNHKQVILPDEHYCSMYSCKDRFKSRKKGFFSNRMGFYSNK